MPDSWFCYVCCRLAVQAHLWPVALVISQLLGPKALADCIVQFAEGSLAASPLRTVCLLSAGAGNNVIPCAAPDQALVQHWREHLAVIIANRTPGDERVLEALGRTLISSSRVIAGHTCLALAGLNLQYAQPAAVEQFSLVGANAHTGLRGLGALPAILRTEIYSWCHTNGERGA